MADAKTTTQPTMHVKVYSPYKTYFDDEAYSVTALNATGPFDILPHHHNFMTLLGASDITVRGSSGDHNIRISQGVMHVKTDKVIIFLDV